MPRESIDRARRGLYSEPLENFPDLMDEYLQFLNRSRAEADPSDDDVRRAVRSCAWECLKDEFFPVAKDRRHLVDAITSDGIVDGNRMLDYLTQKLHVLTSKQRGKLAFSEDPMAEYMSGWDLTEKKTTEDAWREFLRVFDEQCQDTSSARGFLLATAEYCDILASENRLQPWWKVMAGELRTRAGEDIASYAADEVAEKLEVLRRIIEDDEEDRELVVSALRSAAKYGPMSLPLIEPNLDNEHAECRSAAFGAFPDVLGNQPDSEIVQLSSRFTQHSDPDVCIAALSEIVRGGIPGLTVLAQAVDHTDERVRKKTIALMESMAMESVVEGRCAVADLDQLRSYLTHSNPSVVAVVVVSAHQNRH